ncbi:unnamed protein product [Symbiodinium natans]|uniref:Uncharacterized protein n=1 Tax=Symbiodinium natans TaxID=878477 RepID=A0A812VAA8_9DINO|nr:unnamed protein product [Symbiodinium natans]
MTSYVTLDGPSTGCLREGMRASHMAVICRTWLTRQVTLCGGHAQNCSGPSSVQLTAAQTSQAPFPGVFVAAAAKRQGGGRVNWVNMPGWAGNHRVLPPAPSWVLQLEALVAGFA